MFNRVFPNWFETIHELNKFWSVQKRCVIAKGNPSAFAVGEMLMNSTDMSKRGKGKALKVINIYKIEL